MQYIDYEIPNTKRTSALKALSALAKKYGVNLVNRDAQPAEWPPVPAGYIRLCGQRGSLLKVKLAL